MKILVTGGAGMLGRTLRRVIESRGHRFCCADLPDWDITRAGELLDAVRAAAPDQVIHCAAMTAVDLCESRPELAFGLNEGGSANVAAACAELEIPLLAVSTDYVFSGNAGRPYREDDPAGDAMNVYGRSKFAGEQAVARLCPSALICRIGWLYGAGGPSFPHTMLKIARDMGRPVRVVDDQRGNPTSAMAAAEAMMMLIEKKAPAGIWHLTCSGEATWAEFAREL
ncbi:MAG: dTDP-4-dehydrorhamnose reductase, partial [Victivallales bacterium]|nr:dTDP-4-dehydrorhamnose reductase [Victivallales bacterium]